MIKFKIISFAAIAIGGLASLIIHQKSQVNFRENETLIRQQDEQLASLTAENQRLSNLAAGVHATPPDNSATELTKLRAEADTLKNQTNALAAQLQKIPAPRPPPPTPVLESNTPEYWEQLHQMAGNKSTDARDLASAFFEFASEHQNQAPANLDELAPYLAKQNMALSGTNQFEIVYHGSLDDLNGIPNGTVAVVRDQQTWQGPDGKLMRVYGLANGVGQVVSSDDNFQAWESKHVISPPNPAQPGQ